MLDETDQVVSTAAVPLSTLGEMRLSDSGPAVVPLRIAPTTFVAQVSYTAAAMFVALTTLAHGRYEDNAVLLAPGRKSRSTCRPVTALVH